MNLKLLTEFKELLLNELYPIGKTEIFYDNADHSNYLGFKWERTALDRFIKGESYITIAQKLDSPVKSVDNAIQRIRKKAIKNMFNETE